MFRPFRVSPVSALVGVGFALGAWMVAPEERVRAFVEAVDNWLTPSGHLRSVTFIFPEPRTSRQTRCGLQPVVPGCRTRAPNRLRPVS